MDIHDKLDVLAANASICAAVMMRSDCSFVLVDLNAPDLPALKEELLAKSFGLGGVIGLVDGKPQVTFTVPLDPSVVHTISVAFLRLVRIKINARVMEQGGDSIEWLQRLATLPDMREKHDA